MTRTAALSKVAPGARPASDLALGSVDGMAFFAVCGLIGVTLALLGLYIYEIAKLLEGPGGQVGESKIVAGGLEAMLRDAGTTFGLAGAVYLLAPAPEDELADDALAVTQAP